MHPRNMYKVPPDFSKLAIKYPEFLKISSIDLNGTVRINFKDKNTVRILTKCLLHSDFGLHVDIPSDRLVPTIPLRLNYLLWLEDILEQSGRKEHIFGIDIGTGACAIYPLLAASNFKWSMMGTEVDENSVNMALKNIKENGLEKSILIKKVADNSDLLIHCFKSYEGTLDNADFCMCNPPFYASIEDMDLARTTDRSPPRNARTGSIQEIVTEGGEVAFVSRLIQESLKLKHKIKIYTTMLGHKSSLKPLLKILRESGFTQVISTTFTQGRTMRWGLAWSYMETVSLCKLQLSPKTKTKNKCMSFAIPPIDGVNYNVRDITMRLLQIFKTLEMQFKILQQKDVICTMELKALKNTWSNQRRKRRQEKFAQCTDNKFNNKNVSDTQSDKKVTQNEFNGGCVGVKRQHEDSACDDDSKRLKTDIDDNKLCRSEIVDSQKSCQSIETMDDHPSGPSTSCTIDSKENYLTCAVCIRKHETYLVLEIGYLNGIAGKDGVHQVVQYIKNNWV